MHKDEMIKRQISAILEGSRLPMDRREEVADELRGHIEQLVAAKHEEGLSEEQAVEAALAGFGSPAVIRKQLVRQQRVMD